MICRRWSQIVCRTALAVLMLILVSPSAIAAFKYLREGMTAPRVTGTDLISGDQVSTESWLKENVVIVVFWSTWSSRSIDELRDMKAFAEEHPDLALRIVGVNVDGENLLAPERTRVVDITTELELPFPVILDAGLELFNEFGVIAVPSTAVLDSTGALRYAPSGYSLTTRDRIVDSVELLLGLKEPSEAMAIAEGYRPTKQAGRYCGMAVNQINRRQYKRALKNLDLARQADTGFSQPYVLRGEIFLALDSTTQAIEAFGRAADLDSGSVAAWTGGGIAWLRAGETDSALARLSHALKLDDTYTPACLNLGICLAAQGNMAEALDSLTKALELNPRDPLVHYYIGQLHLKDANHGLATEAYRSALEILFPPE